MKNFNLEGYGMTEWQAQNHRMTEGQGKSSIAPTFTKRGYKKVTRQLNVEKHKNKANYMYFAYFSWSLNYLHCPKLTAHTTHSILKKYELSKHIIKHPPLKQDACSPSCLILASFSSMRCLYEEPIVARDDRRAAQQSPSLLRVYKSSLINWAMSRENLSLGFRPGETQTSLRSHRS